MKSSGWLVATNQSSWQTAPWKFLFFFFFFFYLTHIPSFVKSKYNWQKKIQSAFWFDPKSSAFWFLPFFMDYFVVLVFVLKQHHAILFKKKCIYKFILIVKKQNKKQPNKVTRCIIPPYHCHSAPIWPGVGTLHACLAFSRYASLFDTTLRPTLTPLPEDGSLFLVTFMAVSRQREDIVAGGGKERER